MELFKKVLLTIVMMLAVLLWTTLHPRKAWNHTKDSGSLFYVGMLDAVWVIWWPSEKVRRVEKLINRAASWWPDAETQYARARFIDQLEGLLTFRE